MALSDLLARSLRSTRVPRSFQPLASQALNEALVRFGPQYDQLNLLRQGSAQQMRQQVGQAESAAQLISALANETQRNINSNSNPLIQRLAQYDNPPAGSSSAVVAQNLGLTRD